MVQSRRKSEIRQGKTSLEKLVDLVEGLNNSVEDLNELFELSEDESEANQLKEELLNVEEKIADLEFRRMFSGKMDQANTYLDIQSGSGGRKLRIGQKCSYGCI